MLSGAGIQNFPYNFIYIGQSRLLKLQAPVWYMLFIVALAAWLCRNGSVGVGWVGKMCKAWNLGWAAWGPARCAQGGVQQRPRAPGRGVCQWGGTGTRRRRLLIVLRPWS